MKLFILSLAFTALPTLALTPSQSDARDIAQGLINARYAIENLIDQYKLFSSKESIDGGLLDYNNFALNTLLAQVSQLAEYSTAKLFSTDVRVVQNALSSLNSVVSASASNVLAKHALFSSKGLQYNVAAAAAQQVTAANAMFRAIKNRIPDSQAPLVTSDLKVFNSKYSSVLSTFSISNS